MYAPRWGRSSMVELVFFTPDIHLAQATPILESALNRMESIDVWWDEVWEATFRPTATGGSSLTMEWLTRTARWLLNFVLPIWIFKVALGLNSRGQWLGVSLYGLQNFAIGILIAFLLSGNGVHLGNIAYGLRNVLNSATQQMAEIQILDLSIRDAINSRLMIEDGVRVIGQQAEVCRNMPLPAASIPSIERPSDGDLTPAQEQVYAYIACYQKVQTVAEEAIEKANNCPLVSGQQCSMIQGFFGNIAESVKQAALTEADKIANGVPPNPFAYQSSMADLIAGNVAMALFKEILSAFQWFYSNFLELALYLSGIAAPFFVVLALVPGYVHTAAGWLGVFIGVGLNKLAYIFILGVMSILLSQTRTAFASDISFHVILGLGAPFTASALVWGGGLVAAKAFLTPINTAVGTATSALSVAGFALASGVARKIDRGR